ncbi:MAG: DUF2064 domain-containing protein [Proteobacteria bacterium]|nr:DUF2064 domain-containing protein [Pseudomonadota bacterium]NIS71091.1 DUF2064 domain-containing protein [Pseudomonadota bacterium]
MKTILVIVAKEPVPGRVKTRLSSRLGAKQASELYRLSIQDMTEEMSNLSENTLAIAYTPRDAERVFKKIFPSPIRLFPQEGENLGERLSNIFKRMFAEGYHQVHIINSDSPDLSHRLIERSIRLLQEPKTDVILGPCADGGYYLVGLKRLIPELFARIPWSTDQVLNKTLETSQRLGLQCALLSPWYDIDTYDDMLQFLERNGKRVDTERLPGWRTLKYLRTRIKPG